MVRSCVLTLDTAVYASLAPGAMAYFHVVSSLQSNTGAPPQLLS